MYEYRATATNVVDGDTLDVAVDLGFDVIHNRRLRLFGINAPELHAKDPATRAAAQEAKAFLADALTKGQLVIRTHKDKAEKYGRMLAELFVDGSTISVNDQLLQAKLAVPFMVDEA